MNKNIGAISAISTKFIAVVGFGLALIGCSSATPPLPTLAPTPGAAVSTTGAATPANTASSTDSTLGQPIAAASPTIKDACAILTASAIRTILGIEFGEGTSKPSFTQGSSCEYKLTGQKATGSLLLQIGVGKEYYLGDAMKPGEGQSAGVGDKSFIMGTTCTNTSAGVLKGNIVVTITLSAFTSTNTSCGADQIKALLKAITDQL